MSHVTCHRSRVATSAPHQPQPSKMQTTTPYKCHTSQASHATSITRHKHHTSQASHVTSTASLQRRHQPTRVRSTAHHNPWPQSVTLLQCYSDTVLQFVTVLQCGTVLQCYSVTLSQHHNAATKQQRTFARAVSQCRNIYVYIYIYICIYIYIYVYIYMYIYIHIHI